MDSDFFSQMALELQAAPTAEATLALIAEYAKQATSCDDAGIMLVHGRNRHETATATSRRVAEAHDLQIELDEGPCLDAIEGDGFYLAEDISIDPRWPRWGPAVAALGLRTTVSVRMETRTRRYGSLNLYSATPGVFDEDDLRTATILSRHASVALANVHNEEGLHFAIDARKLIGQAQGIFMERYGIDADRAFDVLRRHSQHNNIKLREVADQVIAEREAKNQPSR